MALSFYKFVNKEKYARTLPKEVISELNADLPRGYHYVFDKKKGQYRIVPSQGEEHKISLEIDLEKNGIPSWLSKMDILDYLYRTQKEISVTNLQFGDGEKTISFDEMNKNPMTLDKENGECEKTYILRPSPFPPARKVIFQCENGMKRKIDIRRLPFEDMKHVKYGNINFPALKIEAILPDGELGSLEKDMVSQINISAIPQKAKSTREAIVALNILKSFSEGTLSINGNRIGRVVEKGMGNYNSERVNEEIELWTIFNKLEKCCKVRFDPRIDCSEDESKLLQLLSICIVEGKDLIYKAPFSHFRMGVVEEELAPLRQNIGIQGSSIAFVKEKLNYKIMGAELQIYETNVLVDMKIDDIIYADGNAEFIIDNHTEIPFRLIRKYYLDAKEANDAIQFMYEKYSNKGKIY